MILKNKHLLCAEQQTGYSDYGENKSQSLFLRNQQTRRGFAHIYRSFFRGSKLISPLSLPTYTLTFIIFIRVITLVYSKNRNGFLQKYLIPTILNKASLGINKTHFPLTNFLQAPYFLQ